MALAGRLLDARGELDSPPEPAGIEQRLRTGEFFWLDVERPDADDLALLGEMFGWHPLALEDSTHFDQRPKLEEFDEFVFLVAYGWAPDEDGLVEVHCYYSERALVTLRRDECPAFADLRRRLAHGLGDGTEPILVLHRVVDALVDGFFPVLARFADRLDLIEDAMFATPSDRQLQEVFSMKRRLVTLRKTIEPQRELFGRLTSGVGTLPGTTSESERYFRDLYDHLVRLSEMIDDYRDLMTGAIDMYLSNASNRMNAVMKQLTVIATVFLPLTFVTGFFGQNFGWMVREVGGWVPFVGLGLGVQAGTLVALLVYFRRQGWFR